MPITTSTAPDLRPAITAFISLGVRIAREQLDLGGIGLEAVGEGVEVLLRQHRGGHEHRHLAPLGHRLEGGAERDLGLAIAHVARHQPVHGALALHVGLHLVDGLLLVRRLLEAERRLELALPRRIRPEGGPRRQLALGVELEQLLRHLAERGAHRLLDLPPRGAPEPVQLGRAVRRPHVLRDEVEPLHRQIEPAALRSTRGGGNPTRARLADERLEPVIAPHAVRLVHHEVVDRQVGEGRDGGAPLEARPLEAPPARAEDLLLGEDAPAPARGAGSPSRHRPPGRRDLRCSRASPPARPRARARRGSSGGAMPGSRR